METVEKLEQWPTATMPIKVFSAHYMRKETTIRSWISRGVWTEGDQFSRDSLGHVHIILSGYEQWTLGPQKSNTPPAPGRTVTASKSSSSRRATTRTDTKHSRGTPPLLT